MLEFRQHMGNFGDIRHELYIDGEPIIEKNTDKPMSFYNGDSKECQQLADEITHESIELIKFYGYTLSEDDKKKLGDYFGGTYNNPIITEEQFIDASKNLARLLYEDGFNEEKRYYKYTIEEYLNQ